MTYTLLLGGARSGKSALAERLAHAAEKVVFVATAAAGDEEMTARIAQHRQSRPRDWATVETPIAVGAVVESTSADAMIVVDCLTLWVSNLMEDGFADAAIVERAHAVAYLLARRPGPGIVVSNEVGSGIVPDNELARRFRDLLGRVNIAFADRADRTFLVVAGRTLELS